MKGFIINNCLTYINGKFTKKSFYILNNKIELIDNKPIQIKGINPIDCSGKICVPGLIDIHTHLRQPGYEYKETIKTGTKAAAAGGYTTICCMPNLVPPTDSVKNIKSLISLIKKDALINVLPYASITKGKKIDSDVSDIKSLSKYCFGFSNDGCGVSNSNTLEKAMRLAKSVKKPIIMHAEDLTLIPKGGCVNEGIVSKKFKLVGIPNNSEHEQVKRDIELAIKTKCQYHVCHVSCKKTLDLIKKGIKKNKHISCEVTPHHLLLNENDIKSNDGKYKMNPPLRSKKDQQALLNGIKTGLIKVIATDHAPHSLQEKSKGLANSSFGISSLDYSFALLYTKLVKSKIITLKRLIELMSINPSQMFNIPSNEIKKGNTANLMIFDPNLSMKIDPKKFFSKGKSTPFENTKCWGWPIYTICNGKIVYKR